MQQQLKKDYFWNSLGVLLQNATSPILLLVITRLNGLEASGVFSFTFSVAVILWVFAMWGGRTYQVSDVQSEFKHQSYIVVRVLLAIITIFASVIFCLLNQYSIEKTSILLLLTLFVIVQSLSDVIYGVMQVRQNLYKSGVSLTIKFILGMAAFIVIDVYTGSIAWSVVGLLLVNIAVFLVYDIRIAASLEDIRIMPVKYREYTHEAIRIIKTCARVFILLFLPLLAINIPRYFIDVESETIVGYFGILAMPITLISVVISFIVQPSIVTLTKMLQQKKYDDYTALVKRIVYLSAAIGVAVIFVALFVGVPLLNVIFGLSFDEYRLALIVMVIGGVFNAITVIYLNLFIILRTMRVPLFILIVGTIVSLPISYLAVHEGLLLGGVTAFLAVGCVQFLVVIWYYEGIIRKLRKS